MDIKDIRRVKLTWIRDTQFAGVAAHLARAVDRSAPQVNQWLSGARNMGEDSAAVVEKELKLPPGAMSREPPAAHMEAAARHMIATWLDKNKKGHTLESLVIRCMPMMGEFDDLRTAQLKLQNGPFDSELLLAIEEVTEVDLEFPAFPGFATTPSTGSPDPAKHLRMRRSTPVIGLACLGEDGLYERFDTPDGWVDGYSSNDPDAYALRVRGDRMHPAIRHGSFIVVEPRGRCVPGEYVAVALLDGSKMVKELVIERQGEIVVESVNGNSRRTIDRTSIESAHPVVAVVAASKWRPT